MLRSLIVFMMMMMMMTAGTSLAEGLSKYSVDTVPIQFIHKAEHPVTTLSGATDAGIFDFPPGFSAFVTTVTEHVVAKLAQEKLCLDSAESKERSLLQFATYPISSGPRPAFPPLEARPYAVCRISSPWADLVVEKKPVPSVRGIFRYNERQLLADQAVLAGARNVPPGMAMPLTEKEFNQYADLEYAHSEIHGRPAVKSVEERVPPDLLWLFRRASQNRHDNFPGSAGSSMRKAMRISAEGYTRIVIALIDQCFTSEGADIHYSSILDIADLVSLDQYKITTSIVALPIIEIY